MAGLLGFIGSVLPFIVGAFVGTALGVLIINGVHYVSRPKPQVERKVANWDRINQLEEELGIALSPKPEPAIPKHRQDALYEKHTTRVSDLLKEQYAMQQSAVRYRKTVYTSLEPPLPGYDLEYLPETFDMSTGLHLFTYKVTFNGYPSPPLLIQVNGSMPRHLLERHIEAEIRRYLKEQNG